MLDYNEGGERLFLYNFWIEEVRDLGRSRRPTARARRAKQQALKGLRKSYSLIEEGEEERGSGREDKISKILVGLKKEGKIPYFAKTKRSVKRIRRRVFKPIFTKEGGFLDSENVDILLGLLPACTIEDFINFLQNKRHELDKIKIKQSVNYLKKNLPDIKASLGEFLEFLGQIERGKWDHRSRWLYKLDWKIREFIRFLVFTENPFFVPIQVTSSLSTLKRKLEEQKEWEKRTGKKRPIVFVYWEPIMSPQAFWEQTAQEIKKQRGGKIGNY